MKVKAMLSYLKYDNKNPIHLRLFCVLLQCWTSFDLSPQSCVNFMKFANKLSSSNININFLWFTKNINTDFIQLFLAFMYSLSVAWGKRLFIFFVNEKYLLIFREYSHFNVGRTTRLDSWQDHIPLNLIKDFRCYVLFQRKKYGNCKVILSI